MTGPACRLCGAKMTRTLVDLGRTPLANAYLTADQVLRTREPNYPLRVRVCDSCLLVQVEETVPAESIFTDYAYFSSYSSSWVDHARRYAATMIERYSLGAESLVMEVASNDGYPSDITWPRNVLGSGSGCVTFDKRTTRTDGLGSERHRASPASLVKL